jgi:hypothetical protein
MKIINTKNTLKRQLRGAMKNYIGKPSDPSLIEDKVSAILNKLVEQVIEYDNLKIVEEPCIEFELYLPNIDKSKITFQLNSL